MISKKQLYELISFTVGAVLLVLGIGLFNMGADIAMTPMGTHVGAGLSRQKKLMMVVEKDIRDGVLHSLYKQMGMHKKAQGIVFSPPVTDVAGLVKLPDEDK